MLATTTTSQVNERVAMVSAFVTQTVLNFDDISFLQQSDWGVLELAHLEDGLLSAGAAH